MPRIARVVAPGLPHHITQRGNDRCTVFFDDDDRRFYLWTLAKYQRKYGLDTWAYCLMDNHVHVLGVPERDDSLARCFAGTNLVYTQYLNKKRGRGGRLWQNRFFSCPVDKDEYFWPVLRYIEVNPVRAQLARNAWDYVWSSARHHVLGEPDPVVSGPDWLAGELKQRKYRSYLAQAQTEAEEEIRRMTASGRPLGSQTFVAKLESTAGRRLAPGKAGMPRLRRG